MATSSMILTRGGTPISADATEVPIRIWLYGTSGNPMLNAGWFGIDTDYDKPSHSFLANGVLYHRVQEIARAEVLTPKQAIEIIREHRYNGHGCHCIPGLAVYESF